jgi:polyisoprenoid-binding protein YceI
MTSTQFATKTTTWQLDPSHTNVEFAVKHMMVSRVKGSFPGVTGTITIDEENFANSSAEVEIDVSTITTRDEKRDEHLRSADFFNVEAHPTMRFVSTGVKSVDGDEFKLAGDLTISGITMPVELKVERTGTGVSPWGSTVAGFEAETKISRKDFGLTWNVALEAGGFMVGDEIKIHLDIEAIQQ